MPTGWAGPGPKGGGRTSGALQVDHPLQALLGPSGARFAVNPPLSSRTSLRLDPRYYPPGIPTQSQYPTPYTHPVHPPDDHQFYMSDLLEQPFSDTCRRT